MRIIYLGRPSPTDSCSLPASRAPLEATPWVGTHLLLGFAPGEVYRAVAVASGAVGSYPTFSPSPATRGEPPVTGSLFSVALSVRATGMRAGNAARELPGAMPYGARTFLYPSAS